MPPKPAATPPSSPGTEFEIKPLPASCRLLPTELRKREATLLKELRLLIETATPLADGYALRLQFRLTCAQESRALVLEIRGSAGSRELLAQVLQLPDATAKP